MPPRFAYWTILIDDKPTAFRAQYKEDLQPTFFQLQRTNPNAVMRWFARGKLWDTPEQAQWAARNLQEARQAREKRTREWRPGGEHKDPRARFDKRRPSSAERHGQKTMANSPARAENRRAPWRPKTAGQAFRPAGKDNRARKGGPGRKGPNRG